MPPKKAKTPAPPRTQRKIHHLLRHEGHGGTFKYFPELNPAVNFSEGEDVILTEKWDGTTVQATKDGIFKRTDKFSPGDPKKHGASESERIGSLTAGYGLELLDLDSPKNKWISRAVENYKDTFAKLEEGQCVYFEAIGQAIGSRFQNLDDFYDIRVFDFSEKGEFLPFEETIYLAEQMELPLVHYEEAKLNLNRILQLLREKPSYHDMAAENEGYVVRKEQAAAKIRVADYPTIVFP